MEAAIIIVIIVGEAVTGFSKSDYKCIRNHESCREKRNSITVASHSDPAGVVVVVRRKGLLLGFLALIRESVFAP